jgi:hypothetical protein
MPSYLHNFQLRLKELTILSLIASVTGLAGCTKSPDFYTNPNKGGYLKQEIGGLCISCKKPFKLSSYQITHYENITCAYCKVKQDPKQALVRYVHYQREQDRIKAQQAAYNSTVFLSALLSGVAIGLASYNHNPSFTPYNYVKPISYKPLPPFATDDRYKSSFGNTYKYDLSNPSDQIMYSVDPSAQLMDSLYKPITPSVGLEESIGEHGGGLAR